MKNIILVFVLNYSLLFSQSFDMLKNFETGKKIIFIYHYNEFDPNAYKDSTIILTSFDGQQVVKVDSAITFLSDSLKYYLTIEKIGKEMKHNFRDTLSTVNIHNSSRYIICQNNKINEVGAEKYIYGWIFPDTLIESVIGTWDPIIYYPYSKLFRIYSQSNGSLYIINDTLAIQYRPITTNYWDSYYSQTYYVDKSKGLVNYSRYYSYYGVGFDESLLFEQVTSIKDDFLIPKYFYLYQNYPNPFNPMTNIKFALNKSSEVKLLIYDMLGREVEKLLDEYKTPGIYEIQFNGSQYSSGVYFYRLISNEFVTTKKFTLLK